MENEQTELMFSCYWEHKLDGKGRVAVPAGWAAAKEGTLFLVSSEQFGFPILKCYTRAAFAKLIRDIRSHYEGAGKTAAVINLYVKRIMRSSQEVEVGTQGKLLIPKQQRERLMLEESVTFVGCDNYFELWKPEDLAASEQAEEDAVLELDADFGVLGTPRL